MIKTAALCLAASALVSASASADTIFSNDFESGLGGNESVDGIFTVNNTSSLGNGSFGVGHDANGYTSGEWSSYYLTLDLSNYQNVLLTFDFSGDIENHFDGFNVVDEGTALITPLSGMTYDSQLGHFHTPFTTGGDDYYDSSAEGSGTAMFDLSAQGYDGNGISNVTFRFQFGSDGSVTFAGIWMDNVTVTGDLIPAPGAVALLGLGGIGFMGRRRRR